METFQLTYIHHTDNAILVYDTDPGDKFWLPKSQIEFDPDDLLGLKSGEIIEIDIPDWLVEKHDLF